MYRTFLAIARLCLASAASGQSVGEKTGVNSTLGITPTTADFVKQVAISDIFEIQSNKAWPRKGNKRRQDVRYAQMVTDHTKTSTELKTLVSSGKLKADSADCARQRASNQARQT